MCFQDILLEWVSARSNFLKIFQFALYKSGQLWYYMTVIRITTVK